LGKDRDKIIISSKFGRNSSEGNTPNFHAKRARESVEASLQRLRTDRLDVLFFHSPFRRNEIHDEVWEALDKLKADGKIRFVGHSISMFQNTQQMARDWAAEHKIDVIQVVYSLLNREATNLMRDLGKEKIGIVARESLANGFLYFQAA
jgi:aryl-alcohol dehydrogenase-like predicted oxidoreductase